MSELNHLFKLKVTKGDQTVEVEIAGSEKFVTPGFQDIRAAALTFLHREAGQPAIIQQVAPHILEQAPGTASTTPLSAESTASASVAPATSATPPASVTKKPKKSYPSKAEEKSARKALVESVRTAKFEGLDSYTAAIQSAQTPADRAALVTQLAHDKCDVDGLSPAEVRYVLEEKFKVGQDARSLEEAMKAQPTSFYLVAPADFDKRAKLYRPMTGCTDQVNKLLKQQEAALIAGSGTARSNGNGTV